jgi:hypothetical protein
MDLRAKEYANPEITASDQILMENYQIKIKGSKSCICKGTYTFAVSSE